MWFPYALFSAVTGTFTFLATKKLTGHLHPITLLFFSMLCTVLFMAGILAFTTGIPSFTALFVVLMTASSLLDLIGFICFMFAVKHTPISVIAPLYSLTPVFATLFGFFFLNEIPDILKLTGILTVAIGVYFLNISEIRVGIFSPFKKLISDKGTRYYFITIVIFGFTPILQKPAIFQTTPVTPLFASFFGFTLITLYLGFIVIKFLKQKKEAEAVNKNIGLFLLLGFSSALGQYAGYTAFSMTHVGYVTAIAGTSIFFTILFGGLFFKETKIKERLFAAIIMIIGVILIAV